MDARIAELIDRLCGLVESFGAERLGIAAMAAIGLALLVVRLSRRRSGGATGGPARDYAKLESLDISESDRLYRVLAERPGWRELPERLLRELQMRLRSKDNVLQFIAFAEGHRLLDGTLRALDGTDLEADMKAVAAGVAGLAGKCPDDAAALLGIAARIDPENFVVVLALAGDHFDSGRYREALPLLERGIPICRDAVERPAAGSPGQRADALGDLRALLLKSMEMYETCLEQDASA